MDSVDPAGPERPEPDVDLPFDHDPGAPRRARQALAPLFNDGDETAAEVTLVASELVSNVIQHTDDGGELRAWRGERVRIEVSDGDPVVPQPREEPTVLGGRGLRIVAQLADAWGTAVEPQGKTVWAEFGGADGDRALESEAGDGDGRDDRDEGDAVGGAASAAAES